jgi:hypothetical protein
MSRVHHKIRKNELNITYIDIDIIIVEDDEEEHIIPSSSRYLYLSHDDVYELEILNCEYNNLTSLPVLHYLQHLNCSNNNLIELTTAYHDLWSLECCHNKLIRLPELPTPYLESIYCDYNYITDIPSYSKLRYLSCTHNKLVKFPINLCINLQYVALKGNPFTYDPIELVKYKLYASETPYVETDVNEVDSIITHGEKIMESQLNLPDDIKYLIFVFTGQIVVS